MSLENPTSILFNTQGNELAVSSSQTIDVSGSQPGIMIAGSGSDGKSYFLRSTATGDLFVTGAMTTTPSGIQTVTGTVHLDNALLPVSVSNFPAVQEVTGTITAQINQVVSVSNGGPNGTSFNPIFVSSSATSPVFITGSVTATATLQPNTPVSQGLPGGISDAWNIKITDGTQVLGTGSSAPLWVTGTVGFANGLGSSTNPIYVSSSTTAPVWVTGSITTTAEVNPTATVASVASTVTGSGVTLKAANGSRRGLTIYNDSTKILFVKLGPAVTVTDFSVKLSAQGYYEVPANYTGIVTGVWSGVNGFAYVTEILD